MYTKFYDNTIQVKFIKQLVAKTNVPLISTWKGGDLAIKGMFYVTRDSILECINSGIPRDVDSTVDGKRFFKRVAPFKFGEEYYNITGHFISNSSGYDPTTHWYLGQYLRMMRDIFDLDLMPFYNCFCGEYLSDIEITEDKQLIQTNEPSITYKTYSVPVKFNKKYMIALNSDSPYELMLGIYGKKGLISKYNEALIGSYKKVSHSVFTNPFVYNTEIFTIDRKGVHVDGDKLYNLGLNQLEKYLKLFIRVPVTNKSSLVVIEGDYSNIGRIKGINVNSKTVSGDIIRPKVHINKYLWRDYIDKEDVWNRPYEVEVDGGSVVVINGHLVNARTWEEMTNTIVETETVDGVVQYKSIKLVSGELLRVTPEYTLLIRLGRDISKGEEEYTLSPLGLLQISDGNMYAFSDRLLEYLSQNSINKLDKYSGDIQRVQNDITSYIFYKQYGEIFKEDYVDGVWNDDMKQFIYRMSVKGVQVNHKIDLNGYVDKDTEGLLERGQE